MTRSFPLHEAAYDPKTSVSDFKAVLTTSAHTLTTLDDDRRAPLHWACSASNEPLVAFILASNGVDYNAGDEGGWTPLHIASSTGDLAIFKRLLEAGADLSVTTERGQTPLHYASSKGHLAIVSEILKVKGDLVSARDAMGMLPLHRAAAVGAAPVVKALLHAARDLINARDKQGNTPLHHACESNQGDVVRILVEHGAKTDIQNDEERLARDCSSDETFRAVCKKLFAGRD